MQTLKLIDGALEPVDDPHGEEISLAAWREGARPEAGVFALALPNDALVEEVGPGVNAFAAVVLEFPTFRDGRAYSQARILRERFGFRGEIRARGEILRDQIAFMARCGFNAFEVDPSPFEGFGDALREISHVYQPAADAAAPVWRQRARRALAAE